MTQIKIGSRVVTRKFANTLDTEFTDEMNQFIDKEGEVIYAYKNSTYLVHGYVWPQFAVELVRKEWEPEYGKEYEFSDDEREWVNQIFAAINPIESNLYKYLAVDKEGCDRGWKYVRPIRRTLEDQFREVIRTFVTTDDAVTKLMSIIANHQSEFTEEEIEKQYYKELETMGPVRAVIRTVRHFIALANETNGKK